ncbi:MAG TPA: D-arabinono-1,4-lactone oxidase [Acidimicrobiales bacterium]|nr:D-arabinono-1,4-lactone oxidase [Acidimicrobiales bacterium]
MANVTETAWRNWAGNQVARPRAVHHPASEDELSAIVKRAAAEGTTVKVVGAGHSFSDIACTDGHLIELDRCARVLEVDDARRRVTVEAGIPLERLNLALEARGLALPNLGDIAYQTVAGATQTSTHGTGAQLGGLATQIVGMRLLLADGSALDCSADEHADVLAVARVGLGALGVVSRVTLQCVPAFLLHAHECPLRLDAVLEELDDHVARNDHFEFFWVPHTGWALTKANNCTEAPLSPRGRFAYWRDKSLLENYAFGLVCRVGRRRPAWIPRLARALPASGGTDYVEPSYRVFASPRRVRFLEMEYAIPREACAPALRAVRRFVDDAGLMLNFPVEVRFTAPDDIPLSTASGRPSAYIAVHVFEGMDEQQYFRGVERIMDDHDGRPHWGKLHFQTAATLAPRYPQWGRFLEMRDRLDPERRFANAYTRRVLGD